MDYLIDLKKQDLSGKTALEGGISLGVDTDGNIKKIDESGAISDIGGSVDESRLLPALDSVPVDRSGNPVVFKAVSGGVDEHTLLYCPFDADFNDHSSYARTVTHDTSREGLSISLERNKFGTGSLQGTGYTTAGAVYVQMPTPIGAADFTIHKWIYVTSAADRFGIFSTYGEAGSGTGNPGYGIDGLACWIDTDGTLKLYKASAHFSGYWYDDDRRNKLAEAAMPSDYLNRWVHIAVARSGNIWMLFADGSLLNSNSKEFNAVQPYLRIGSADTNATAYGNIDEFIVLDYAKWITDFEPPTQPASEVTKSYEVSDKGAGAVDESRLLPENPVNGDIPCYSNEPPEGVNYNDANTVLLLQGSSDNTAAASTSERLNGIVTGEFPVQSDGSLLVTGSSNYITFNDADTRRVFSGEFTLETYIKTTQFTSSGARHDTNWCVVYRNDTSNVTNYQWLLLSDFYADAGKFGIWPYPQMSGETFPKTLVNAEFQHVAIDVYMVDGVRKFTMYRNGVPYHTGNYWSTTPADWSSGVSAAMRLFGEGPSGGDDYLSNASVMSLRVSNIARYKGVSFDPPADGKYLNPPAGYWGKINKSALVQNVNGQTPDSSGVVTLPAATVSAAGLMAAADKVKLDSLNITEFKDRPGYFKLPGGIIVQWGAVLDVSETKTFDVTLPLAFPHLGWVSLASGTSTTVATAAYFNGANALKVVTNVTGAGSFAVYWIAIGY